MSLRSKHTEQGRQDRRNGVNAFLAIAGWLLSAVAVVLFTHPNWVNAAVLLYCLVRAGIQARRAIAQRNTQKTGELS
jgi:hypothetical protein